MKEDLKELESIFDQWDLCESERECLTQVAMENTRARCQLLEMPKLLTALLSSMGTCEWVNKPNSAFNGRPALMVMCDDGAEGISKVFEYIIYNVYGGGYS